MQPGRVGFLALAAALALALALGGCGGSGPSFIGPSGGQATPLAGGAVRAYDLTAAPATVELGPGVKVQAWAYNGVTPGPLLTAEVGDLLVVRLHNHLPAGTTIHWHGLDVPNGQDGVAGVTQDAVPPGASATYSFRLARAGTYWYHSHQDSAAQVDRGLYGALVVKPRGTPPGVDATLVYDEWSMGLEMPAPPKQGNVLMRSYITTTVNGRTGAAVKPIAAAAGQPVRLRLVNAGYLTRYVQLPLPVTLAALDGHELAGGPETADAIPLGPGERVDVAFTMPAAPLTVQLVDGFPPDDQVPVTITPGATGNPPLPSPVQHSLLDLLSYPAATLDNPWPDGTAPTRSFTLRLSEMSVMPGMGGMAMDGVQYLLDGNVFPRTPDLHVAYGDRVEITFDNLGRQLHTMHLHGHYFRVLARDGAPLPGGLAKDSVQVPPGHSITIGFVADNPGVWMIHCHQLIHAAGGMMALLVYDGAPRLAQLGGPSGNSPD